METGCIDVERVIIPPTRDLDGFTVRRALPSPRQRMVGPFAFFDQMGPAVLQPGHGLDVRPHPHIGLATVTYLFEGELMHRDSLGTVQVIRPGEVNWMTAGRGIVHSERTPPEQRKGTSPLFGIQVWVALPKAYEEMAPEFAHHDAGELPELEGEGLRMRLIAGALHGARSPVKTLWDMFYADVQLEAGASILLRPEFEERGVFVVGGAVQVGRDEPTFKAGQLLILRPGVDISVRSAEGTPSRVMLLGGAPMDGPRHVWWNFVSSSKDRISHAGAEWKAGHFPQVPGETEFIPLPETGPAHVRYP